MKRHSAFLLSLVAAGAIGVAGCAAGQPAEPESSAGAAVAQAEESTAAPLAQPTTAPQPTDGAVRLADGTVIANARVQPAAAVNLGFEVAGVVAEILVEPGDTVEAGAILGRLDSRQLELGVEEAQAQLAEARANYEELIAGATPEQIARGQAEVDEARARLSASSSNVNKEEIAAAEAELREARAMLNRVKAGPKAEDIAILQAALDKANSRLQTRRDALSAEKNRFESEVARTSNDVKDAQDRYSRIYWQNKAKVDSGATLSQSEIDAEAQALRAVENAERIRDEHLLALEEAKKREVTELESYEADVREAEARLNKALLPAEADELAAAERRVLQAQAKLAELRDGSQEFNQEALAAQVRAAEASYAQLTADPLTSDLAVAEARVARAEVLLKQAELDVERVAIRSPISGTVARIEIEPGQVAAAGTTAFTVADLSSWELIAPDLNELSISLIREGDPAEIRFFALPDLILPGKVTFIETIGRESGVGTSYTVTVTPDKWDERLRWNMSAQVVFAPQQ